MTLLILCNLIFLLVPLVAYLARTHRAVFYVFFGISLVAISWIVFFRILPDTFDHFGLRGILMAVLGFALVGLGETRFRRIPLHPGTLTRLVLITFILVHTVLDGAAIFGSVHLGEETGGHHHQALGYGILVHRLFLGALLWQVLLPGYGRLLTSGIFILMVVGTLLGYGLGYKLFHIPDMLLLLEAFIGGSLLHINVEVLRGGFRTGSGAERRQLVSPEAGEG